ncbi:MAG: hypothetical protein DWQ05_14735 [Calditrichaeota bacterium]|nr:MAG: hypothetical protein DWQ05_14735 [Calditrichota bacterium]
MSFGQLFIILPACIAVAKAFIYFGELEYRGRWLNYLIAVLGGILGAQVGLIIPALNTIALVVSMVAATGLLAVYHVLRWRLIIWKNAQIKQTSKQQPAWQIR